MPAITKRGRNLASKISPTVRLKLDRFGPDWIAERLSLIARHAVTLHRLYEDECNGHPAMGDPDVPIEQAAKLQARWEARTERETARLEKRISELANGLPNITAVKFCGDPRGAPVKLVTKDGSGDSWDNPRGWSVGT